MHIPCPSFLFVLFSHTAQKLWIWFQTANVCTLPPALCQMVRRTTPTSSASWQNAGVPLTDESRNKQDKAGPGWGAGASSFSQSAHWAAARGIWAGRKEVRSKRKNEGALEQRGTSAEAWRWHWRTKQVFFILNGAGRLRSSVTLKHFFLSSPGSTEMFS